MENTTQQQQVQQHFVPVSQIHTKRSLVKYILLNIVTLGIYSIVYYSKISTDINVIASRYDGRKTMHYCIVVFLLTLITLGIAPIVWMSKISGRIGTEIKRRGIDYDFGTADFWLWSVLGGIIIVGPFIYIYKLCVAMNKLTENYNING